VALNKEIEIKWSGESVERSIFNKAIRKYAKGKKFSKVVAVGFDYYYTSKNGYVMRHRHGANTNELTVKARISEQSTTVRKETNIKIAKSASPIQIQEFCKELGFGKVLPVYKDCDIYFIQDGKYLVDVVWYRVSCNRVNHPRVFLEVEVHNAPERASLAILNKWKAFMLKNFELNDKDVINESLYEIYSGNRYRMSPSTGKNK
jgi:adenylate cyclase class IV